MPLLPRTATADARRVLLVRSLRAFADGYVAILLPLHLAARGLDALAVGLIATATLLGSALLTLALGAAAHRLRRRPMLLAAALLMAATGLGFAGFETFWPLLLVAFVGTINPSSGDVSLFLPLEHTVLAESVAPRERTSLFAAYSFVGSVVAACGALSAGAVDWLAGRFAPAAVMDAMFLLYAAIGLAAFLLYRGLSPRAEAPGDAPPAPLGESRGKVYRLAALFSLDALGGGFVVNAMLALWLFECFDLSAAAAGTIFFATGLCTSVSYFAAVWIAGRIGLIRTMVFTHVPANLLLIAAAFAPTVETAAGLLILRSFLSSMDVPARSSYVMAVVSPAERPAAASFTAVPRSLASALPPSASGWLLGLTSFGWPLVIGGVLKLAYDVLLLRSFAGERPPEEQAAAQPPTQPPKTQPPTSERAR